MHKIILVIAIVLFSLQQALASALTLTDVPTTYWANGYIQFVVGKQLMQGYDEAHFGPDNNLTRAESVKIVLNAVGIETGTGAETASFPDVPLSHSLSKFVEEAYKRHIVSGYPDKTFRPNNPVTRGEFTKILIGTAQEIQNPLRTNPLFTDVPVKSDFAPFIYSAREKHYLSGFEDGSFQPGNLITRAQAAKIVGLFVNKGIVPDEAIPPNIAEESLLLGKINASRKAAGKPVLTLNTRISVIAREHSADLANQYASIDKVQWQADNPDTTPPWVAHVSSTGVAFEDRFKARSAELGVDYRVASENVAWATFKSRTVSEALTTMHNDMMALPDAKSASDANQKSNLLSQFNPFTEIGIGIVIDQNKKEITITEEFIEK